MMTMLRAAAVVAFLVSIRSLAAEPPTPTHPVETVLLDWRDAARDRAVPAKVYFPKDGAAPCPVIVFSHGLGGSREGYGYLGEYWAGCGYVSVHVQHAGSDEAVWRDVDPAERRSALTKATLNLANITNRPRDISFALDELTRANADPASPLHGRLDLQRIGVGGHSFGGFTALAIAGQALGPKHSTAFADPRVKSVVQMSAPAPRTGTPTEAFSNIKTPVFHLTGTLDDSPIGDTKPAERRVPFDAMKSALTALLIFEGGDHMVFSGSPRLRGENREKDPVFHPLICTSTTAWWDATLRGDEAAGKWLLEGGFKTQLGREGSFEVKRP